MHHFIVITSNLVNETRKKEDIVVFKCDDASDENVIFFLINRLPGTAELRSKSKVFGNFLGQIEDGTPDTCTYTITEQEQFVHFKDLLLSPEKEIVCVPPLIYKEDDNQYYFKLQKKVKQEMANDFVLHLIVTAMKTMKTFKIHLPKSKYI